MNKTMKFTGIVRSLPQQSTPDGSCQEIVNMRHRKGALRPVGSKTQLYSNNFTYNDTPITFEGVYLHDIEGGIIANEPNWIGYLTGSLYLINPATSICTLIESAIPYADGVKVTVAFLKRTMIVTTSSGLWVFLWNGTQYGKIGSLPTPTVDFIVTKTLDPTILTQYGSGITGSVQNERSHTPEAVLGNYFAILNQQSSNYGKMYGSIMYIVAYRLFDGSYVMHSIPKYLEISNGGWLHTNNPDGGSWDNANWHMILTFGSLQGILVSGSYPAFLYEGMKDIVDSIVVFSTKCTPLFKIDSTTLTESLLQASNFPGALNTNVTRNFLQCFPLNSPDFEELCKSSGWYQIMEFPFSEVVGDPDGTIVKDADMKGFYQDYATRQDLPTDQFSHHNLVGKMTYVYNDRLHLGNVKTIFGLPEINWPVIPLHTQYWNKDAVVVVRLSTSLGKVVVVNHCTIPSYVRTSDSEVFYYQPAIVGYNDSRATKLEIAVLEDGNYKELMNVSLKKNTLLNFAYYHGPDFSIGQRLTNNYSHIMVTVLGDIYAVPVQLNNVFDTNRIQVSEIQNPLVFPAKNSYQVGTGEIIAMSAGSEPLSAGQFGAFPLQVFTSKGIWTMQIGSGDVLYTNVLPVVGEVADNPKNIISVGGSVVYSTQRGLFMLTGNQVTKISDPVEGLPHTSLTSMAEIQKLLTDNRFTPDLVNGISNEDFLTYLDTSAVGYDQHNKELIVSKSGKGYSYVYSFEYKAWYKLSMAFSMLIVNYPFLYGSAGNFIHNISDDDHDGFTQILIVTNAMSLELPDVFKKIEHMIARCVISTSAGTFSGFYLFGSNDLENWELVTGRQRSGDLLKDMFLSRSAGSCKYYVIVFNGNINHESVINYVDMSLIPKLSGKLR